MSNVIGMHDKAALPGAKSIKEVLLEQLAEVPDGPFQYVLVVGHAPRDKDGQESNVTSVYTQSNVYAILGMLDLAKDIIKDSVAYPEE